MPELIPHVWRADDGTWNLDVNGEPVIGGESFATVDQVADRLRHPEDRRPGEVLEVADVIRLAFAHRAAAGSR